MAVSKVVCDGNVLMDLTGDTVTPDKLLAGATAHGADGEPVVGTALSLTVTIHRWQEG